MPGLSWLDRIGLIILALRWRLTWSGKDLNHRSSSVRSDKFVTAREVAERMPDGVTAFSCGFAGASRCSVFFWAIRERFDRTGHPKGLTWMNVGAQGGRGKVPGTVEELATPGLVSTYITGHLETAKAMLRLGGSGQVDLHVLPQGMMAALLDTQGRGEQEVRSGVGLETMMDPSVGGGSAVVPGKGNDLSHRDGDRLVYTMPRVNWAFLNAPWADAEGNVYFRDAASLNENVQAVNAARANGGQVAVTVAGIIPSGQEKPDLQADQVDFLVVHPLNEQVPGVRQKHPWQFLTPGHPADRIHEMARARFLNRFLRITPDRTSVDDLLCDLAADLILREIPKGALANIGVGYPEHVVHRLMSAGRHDHLRFTTEAGAEGGIPLPGIFFGTSLCPDRLTSSLEMFRRYARELDLAVLGFVQVDGRGNVNASLRGPSVMDTIGPGGFPDIVFGARHVVFVGSWQSGATYRIKNGQIRQVASGVPKFVDQVDQVTFSAREAMRLGKKVWYVTHVGIFRLGPKGLVLDRTAPGIDVDRDIRQACPAEICLG